MKTEGKSPNYRINVTIWICYLTLTIKKPLTKVTRNNIISFLASFRKSEQDDPLHKWIGTHNLVRIHIMRFVKWLYYPKLPPKERNKKKIAVIANIPIIKRREGSIYKPSNVWTLEEDRIFLKYCSNVRDRCYFAMSRDTMCRPGELLKLKIKDIRFDPTKRFAKILVNGKTGSRSVPLFNSLPYVKQRIIELGGNDETTLLGSRSGKEMSDRSLAMSLRNYRIKFTELLKKDIPEDDKNKIRDLIKKPFNPYFRRHSALTEKSAILKESHLKQVAGWSDVSKMPRRYIHLFDDEASQQLLEHYGVIPKDQQQVDALKPKECPNCSEYNNPDAKFCLKCKLALSYEGYSEVIEADTKKEEELQKIKEQMEKIQESQLKFIELLNNPEMTKHIRANPVDFIAAANAADNDAVEYLTKRQRENR
jgi:integrase/recombinase XerD